MQQLVEDIEASARNSLRMAADIMPVRYMMSAAEFAADAAAAATLAAEIEEGLRYADSATSNSFSLFDEVERLWFAAVADEMMTSVGGSAPTF